MPQMTQREIKEHNKQYVTRKNYMAEVTQSYDPIGECWERTPAQKYIPSYSAMQFDFLDNLCQDIIDAVCDTLGNIEVARELYTSNIIRLDAGNKFEDYLLSDTRSKTHTMRQVTAEYAYNVARFQKYYLPTLFAGVHSA